MKFFPLVLVAAVAVTLPAIAAATTPAQADQPGLAPGVKIAVIDIDRVAAESAAGKALFEKLKAENEKIAAERQRREQEIRDMQAKVASEVLSVEAKEKLQREIERKRTDAQRWLEDAQREFQNKQQDEEAEFQRQLAPIVEAVARENGIGLILRATPGLTFVLDPGLDLTPFVVERLNETGAPGAGEGAASEPAPGETGGEVGEPEASTPPRD